MGYDYEISYKKGKENLVADALSRLNSSELLTMAVSGISSDLMLEIQNSWEKDEELRELILKLQQPKPPASAYNWVNNQLTKKGRLVVRKNLELQLKLIKFFHEGSLGRHFGMLATIKRLSTVFIWKGMQP